MSPKVPEESIVMQSVSESVPASLLDSAKVYYTYTNDQVLNVYGAAMDYTKSSVDYTKDTVAATVGAVNTRVSYVKDYTLDTVSYTKDSVNNKVSAVKDYTYDTITYTKDTVNNQVSAVKTGVTDRIVKPTGDFTSSYVNYVSSKYEGLLSAADQQVEYYLPSAEEETEEETEEGVAALSLAGKVANRLKRVAFEKIEASPLSSRNVNQVKNFVTVDLIQYANEHLTPAKIREQVIAAPSRITSSAAAVTSNTYSSAIGAVSSTMNYTTDKVNGTFTYVLDGVKTTVVAPSFEYWNGLDSKYAVSDTAAKGWAKVVPYPVAVASALKQQVLRLEQAGAPVPTVVYQHITALLDRVESLKPVESAEDVEEEVQVEEAD